MNSRPLRDLLVFCAVFLVGLAAAHAWAVDAAHGSAAAAVGVGLGAVLCYGVSVVPAAALAVAAVGWALGVPPVAAAAFGLGAGAALWLSARYLAPVVVADGFLVTESQVLRYVLGATCLLPLSTAAAAACVELAQGASGPTLHVLREVLAATAATAMVVAPWPPLLTQQPRRWPPLEALAAAATLLVLAVPVFSAPPEGLLHRMWFVSLLPFAWLAYRHGVLGGLFASLALGVVAAVTSSRGLGPFGGMGQDVALGLSSLATVSCAVSAFMVVNLRQQRTAALREGALASRRLDAAYRLARFGTWEHDLETERWWWSDETYRILGLDPARQDASRALYLSLVVPEDRERAIAAARAAIYDGAPYDLEIRVAPPTGGTRWLRVVGEVLPGGGSARVFAGAVQDVTRHREETARVVSSQKMDALGTLAAGIAHDFNNILLAIQSHTELLTGTLADRSDTHDSLRQILSSTHRASRLVQQILTFGRGEDREQRAVIDVRTPVRASVDFLRATLPATVKLRTKICPEALDVRADRTQLERVIVNLVTNAYQAGGDLVQIDLLVDRVQLTTSDALARRLSPGAHARLRVVDSGPGMEPELARRIFEPFFTTKPVGEGTGLGLSVVHGIVEAHGGTISVDSSPGDGATFEVLLPLSKEEHEEDEAEVAGRQAEGDERVLLVDDEVAVTRGTRRLLRRLGYKVEVCQDGASALALFLDDPEAFDVVVTDHSMPGLTGVELTRAIRKVRPDLPALLTTGFDATQTAEGEDRELFAQVLIKPFGGQELGAAIRAAVDAGEGGTVTQIRARVAE